MQAIRSSIFLLSINMSSPIPTTSLNSGDECGRHYLALLLATLPAQWSSIASITTSTSVITLFNVWIDSTLPMYWWIYFVSSSIFLFFSILSLSRHVRRMVAETFGIKWWRRPIRRFYGHRCQYGTGGGRRDDWRVRVHEKTTSSSSRTGRNDGKLVDMEKRNDWCLQFKCHFTHYLMEIGTVQVYLWHTGGEYYVRTILVSRFWTFNASQTEICSKSRYQTQRVPKGVCCKITAWRLFLFKMFFQLNFWFAFVSLDVANL